MWKTNDLSHLLDEPLKQKSFFNALTVYPMPNAKTMYKIHLAFCKISLEKSNMDIEELRRSIVAGSVLEPSGFKKVTWPVGSQSGSSPLTRFDVLKWEHFTDTHLYLDSRLSNIRPLNEAESADIRVRSFEQYNFLNIN